MNLRFAIILSCSFIYSLSFSQYVRRVRRFSPSFVTTTISISPDWHVNTTAMLKNHKIGMDSVYLYKKKDKNHDSTLVLLQYFDSTGNMTERDQYSFDKGELKAIISLTYEEGLLFKKEEISQPIFITNNSPTLRHDITTYEYDSAGNLITEKFYNDFKESAKKSSITILNREYNIEGHLTKEFETLPTGQSYFHRQCFYDVFGKLATVEIFDQEKKWMYSYQYQFDREHNTQSVFMLNPHERIQESEALYDDQNRLIKIQNYADGEIYANHNTETFNYGIEGLIETQCFHDLRGNNYYFKHFYSYY